LTSLSLKVWLKALAQRHWLKKCVAEWLRYFV
jgi:hypothetical protein